MKAIILSYLVAMILIMGCGNNSNQTPPPPAPTVEPAQTPTVLPLLPSDKGQDIISKVNYVDFIFYNANFSINISDEKNAKGVTTSVLSMNLPPNTSCTNAFGHATFLQDGDILAEAEIFFQQGCTYLVFQENKQNVYTCAIPTRGIEFFNSIMKQQQGQ